ncbi:MAG TPA: hypothetical protein VJB59_12575 [Bdellovibrionota bacterium]|nr:hypothetical protein [Bdellovibrionota bacterium]
MSKSPNSSVRGPSAYNRPASLIVESAAFFTDIGIAMALFWVSLRFLRIAPVPGWKLGFFLLSTCALIWSVQKYFFGLTLGERIWKLRIAPDGDRFSKRIWRKLYEPEQLGRPACFCGIILTVALWSTVMMAIWTNYSQEPLFLTANTWNISPFFPNTSDAPAGKSKNTEPAAGIQNEQWAITPFFYALGAWPKSFRGTPVFYSIPYEVGPPARFIGHIVARWLVPGVQVTFEGPKTASVVAAGSISRDQIRECLLSNTTTLGCLKVREASLGRHVQELRDRFPSNPIQWSLRWFGVENPALPNSEQVQGIYLNANTGTESQSRFILITPKGTHQAVVLDLLNISPADQSPRSSDAPAVSRTDAEYAEQLIVQAIGSLRVSDELTPALAWVDRQLQSVRLDELASQAASKAFLEDLAAIQSLLVAKLSVDPKTFDTYYHLAGTALLLMRHAKENHQNEWSVTAKPLIQSIYRYAQDVVKSQPHSNELSAKMIRLQNLWLDSKKY